MSKVRTFVVVAFDVSVMRWRPVYRCETLERAEYALAPWKAFGALFTDVCCVDCDIDDVEAIEAACAALPRVSLGDVFSAYAGIADHAFMLGGGRFERALPVVAPAKKSIN